MTLQEIIDKEKDISYEQAQKKNALAMLRKNLSNELVSECTGLSLEEIKKLRVNL